MKRLQRAVREENDSLWAFLDEMFRSAPILKAFCAQKRMEEQLVDRMGQLQQVRYRQVVFSNVCNRGFNLAVNSGYLFGLIWCSIGPMRERVEQLAAYWFANKPGAADKELRELEAFCFLSGSYGGYLSQRICLMRKKQKNESGVGWKLQYFWHRLFPPFAILCMRYPKLKTPPWLLPYFWLCRLFDFSYWKSYFHREMATLQQVEQEKT